MQLSAHSCCTAAFDQIGNSCKLTPMIHAFLFAIVFQGLALLAFGLLLYILLPKKSRAAAALQWFNPVIKVVDAITPAVVPAKLHALLGIVWLLFLRVVFYLVMGAYGLLPSVAP
jgi:hypothetical protein